MGRTVYVGEWLPDGTPLAYAEGPAGRRLLGWAGVSGGWFGGGLAAEDAAMGILLEATGDLGRAWALRGLFAQEVLATLPRAGWRLPAEAVGAWLAARARESRDDAGEAQAEPAPAAAAAQ